MRRGEYFWTEEVVNVVLHGRVTKRKGGALFVTARATQFMPQSCFSFFQNTFCQGRDASRKSAARDSLIG